ncbi:MAG: YtxH domain-containing protein [Candidatus Aquilonibacter sp.]|jgi:gas vesicle protein
MNDENGGGNGFFAGFVLGLIAGGAVALLLTQEETRDLLVGKAREAGNLAIDASGDIRESAADLYERGRTIVENARATIGDAANE